MTKKQDTTAQEPSLEALEAELIRRRNLTGPGLAEAVVPGAANERRMRRGNVGARLAKPAVRGDLRFSFPFLSWDAWMVLHHIAREPLEHNKDGTIPMRWYKPLEGRLVPLPEWSGIDGSLATRVPPSLHLLKDLGLLATKRGPHPDTPNLRIGAEGAKCLKEGRAAFFARTLGYKWLAPFDPANHAMRGICQERIEICCWRMGRQFQEFEGLGRVLSTRVLEVLPPVGAALWSDMDGAFAPSDPFVFVRGVPWSERKVELASDEFFDRIDAATASMLLTDSLVYPLSFGLLQRGVTSQGAITWSFTDAGRKWMGLPSAPQDPLPRHIKVTPAYDIYFGRVDPSALAEVSLYAELTRHDHGIVGKLVARSVQAAMGLGISVHEIVHSLEGLVASPLPANVRQSLQDWDRAAQPVVVREGIVLQCPDASTAGTLERLARGSVERLSETVLLLPDRKALTALRKRAGEVGVLL